MNCAFCQTEITDKKIHIRDECSSCGNDLHICLHCEFHDANAYRQCRESIREPVQNKEKANYCDFFRLTKSSGVKVEAEGNAFKELNNLFKK